MRGPRRIERDNGSGRRGTAGQGEWPGQGDEKAEPIERANVAINSMLTRIISEGSNEAAGQRPAHPRSLSFPRTRIYLHNYHYDDYEFARSEPMEITGMSPRGYAFPCVFPSWPLAERKLITIGPRAAPPRTRELGNSALILV